MRKKRLNRIVNRKPKHKHIYVMKPKKVHLTTRDLIRAGHDSICVCCGTTKQLTFDHKQPKSKGGEDSVDNGQILCFSCNLTKGDRIITIDELKKEIAEAEKLKE